MIGDTTLSLFGYYYSFDLSQHTGKVLYNGETTQRKLTCISILVSGRECWAAVNETDFGVTNETLKNYHACIHNHEDPKDMCCIQAHYSNAVGNDLYSFDYDRDFASRNLINGVPLISQVEKILAKLFWYESLKPSIDKVLASRQAVLSQEKNLSLVSIYLETSRASDAERLEKFYGDYKNSQCESFRTLMMPCYVIKVPGQGPYAKNGMIPSKVLLGDGVENMVEICCLLR